MSALFLITPLAAVLFFNLPFSFLRKGIIPFGVAFAVLQALAVMFRPEELMMSFVLPLSADGLSRVMLLAIAVVVAATLLVGRFTMPDEIKRCNFANLVLLALIGMNGVVLCADLFSIYVFVEIAADQACTRFADGSVLGVAQMTQLAVGVSSGLFNHGQAHNQLRVMRDRNAGETEVVHRSQGLDAVIRLSGYFEYAKQVFFSAERCSGGHDRNHLDKDPV